MPLPRAAFVLVPGAAALALGAACGRPEPPPPGPEAAAEAAWVGAGGIQDEPLEEGRGSRRTIVTRGYALRPWSVAVHAEPFRVPPFSRTTPVWITRWSSQTEDSEGRPEPTDIHCHATLSAAPIRQVSSEVFRGIYTDGFTPEFDLPPGFGVRVDAGEQLLFQPMFNNRRPEGRVSRMRLVVDWRTDEEADGSLRALECVTVSASRPELYWVEPGETSRRQREFTMPNGGRIHAIGAHVHPHALLVDLQRLPEETLLFRAEMLPGESPAEPRLATYASAAGIFVEKGARLRAVAVYENRSEERVDAMAGFFLFYDPLGTPDG